MRRIAIVILLLVGAAHFGFAEDASFRTVRIPNLKGKHVKAVLTFSDNDKAVEVRPANSDALNIPYRQIDKCSYQYTEELTIGFTEAKTHWLEIDHHDQDAQKVVVLLMDKRDYLRILDALKTHTGITAAILGNADKRHANGWHAR